MSRHTTFWLITAVFLTTLPGVSPAQPIPPIDVCLEGEITDVIPARNEIWVMGVPMVIPPGVPIVTQVSDLQIDDLLGLPFPGRSQPGFLGGTAIVVGIMNGNEVQVAGVFVEPAENGLGGVITSDTGEGSFDFPGGPVPGALEILGVEVRLLEDPRMPGMVMNVLGFPIDPATILVGGPGLAQGYLGEDGIFYAHTLEADGTLLGDPNQTSIMVALCVEGSKLEIRGGSTTPTGMVSVYDHATNVPLGTAEILPAAGMPGFGEYRFKEPITNCPQVVRVENTNGSSAIARLGPFGSFGEGATAAPVAGQGVGPDAIRLGGARPNPFRDRMSLSFYVPEETRVESAVYDILGRKVDSLLNENVSAGWHQVSWSGLARERPASPGTYFVRFTANGESRTRKVVLVK